MITDWVRDDPDFAKMYARAKEAQADRFAEEIVEISDDGSNDWMEREIAAGVVVTVPDHEHINRSKLRVDTRKFLMAKMAPRKYGDVQTHKHEGTITLAALIAEAAQLEPQVIEHVAPQQIEAPEAAPIAESTPDVDGAVRKEPKKRPIR